MTDDEMHTLGRLDYLIMIIMRTEENTSSIFAVTLKELQDLLGKDSVKRTCIWNHVHKLMDYGYIRMAGKFQQQNTYYITEAGLNLLKEYDNDEQL